MKPLPCTQCFQQVRLVEHYIAYLDQGPAVVREDGVVTTTRETLDEDTKWIGDPVRVMAVCINPSCGHQWTLKRRYDFTWLPEADS